MVNINYASKRLTGVSLVIKLTTLKLNMYSGLEDQSVGVYVRPLNALERSLVVIALLLARYQTRIKLGSSWNQ